MHESVFTRQNCDECSEVYDTRHFTAVNSTHFCFGSNGVNHVDCCVARRGVFAVDAHVTVVIDINRGASLLGDAANNRATLTDNVADLVWIDFEHSHRRRILRDAVA